MGATRSHPPGAGQSGEAKGDQTELEISRRTTVGNSKNYQVESRKLKCKGFMDRNDSGM